MRRLSVLAVGFVLCACQPYEVDPVRPAAAKLETKTYKTVTALSPNVVIVVDRSGSMADSPDETQLNICPVAGQQNIGCKWDELLSVLTGDANPQGGFVYQLAAQSPPSDPLRMGLVTFSGSSQPNSSDINEACKPGVIQVPIGPNTADSINTALEALPPSGATPTASSMQVAASAFQSVQENGRANYVILLTDGAPNCNMGFQPTSANCSGEACTINGYCFGQSAPYIGCLDEEGLVDVITALNDQGNVKTFVIGFGADFGNGSLANDTLNRSALAGGEPRTDPDGGAILSPAFYRASNAADLSSALSAIVQKINASCDYSLDSAPASPDAVQVQVTTADGEVHDLIYNTDYTVNGSGDITVKDTNGWCTRIKAADAANPVTVQIAGLGQ